MKAHLETIDTASVSLKFSVESQPGHKVRSHAAMLTEPAGHLVMVTMGLAEVEPVWQ